MDISTIINTVLSILSFILALISIVTVVITLRQNHTMIENATRPYICVYGESINTGKQAFYLVIKNFGYSPATITKFSYEPDLSKRYGIANVPRDFLSDISKCTLAPGQSKICKLGRFVISKIFCGELIHNILNKCSNFFSIKNCSIIHLNTFKNHLYFS